MKAGWHKKKLGEVCELVNGRAYRKPELLSEGKYKVLRVGNFFTNENWYYSDLELEDKKYCDNGDLLYAWSASFGPRVWTGEKVIFHYHIWKVIPDFGQIDQQFLFYFLEWDKELLKLEKGAGTTMIHVSKGSMEEREILVPPLAEQQRIVAILDEAFEAITAARTNAEQNRQNARALFESYLQSVFSQRGGEWEKTTLEKVLKVQPQNGWSPPAANHSDSGTPVLTLSSVTGFQFKADKIKFTSAPTNNMGRYWVKNGDLLITRSNTPNLVGHVAIASDINQPTIYPDLIMRMNPDPERVMTEFLYFQLRTPALRQEIMGRAQGANPTMKKISNGAVKTLPIVVPRLETQSSIAQSLNQLTIETQRLESLYQRKIAALDELKQSLLQQAFSGNL
ncbi:restriction endonuclease subunit S [Aeromonas veronii]